jgi:hypothetical protein
VFFVSRFAWRRELGVWLISFGSRDSTSCGAVTAVSACLRAIMARHLKGWTLRRARNCRFSAALNVASYARRARASYRQATSANTANAIGTANGIMVDRYHMPGNGEGRPGARLSVAASRDGSSSRLLSPVLSPARISVSSSLLARATMSQKSSLPQPTQSVS